MQLNMAAEDWDQHNAALAVATAVTHCTVEVRPIRDVPSN